MKSFSNTSVYRKFIKQRDEALEVLLHNALIRVDNDLRDVFTHMIYICMRPIHLSRNLNSTNVDGLAMIKQVQAHLDILAANSVSKIKQTITQLRKMTYILTVASESEAIARTLNKSGRYTLSELTMKRILSGGSPSGGTWESRLTLQLNGVIDKLKRTTHWILINTDVSEKDALLMLSKKLPRTVSLEHRRRALKPVQMTEADKPLLEDFATGYINDDDWEDILDEYKKEIFVNRSPEEVFEILGPRGGVTGTPHYAWEMEQEIVQDFIYQVREGQVDAAKQNGIIDFIWIAVVDDKTDECCLWRDGLTTTEIEKRLKSDKRSDECQVINPPAHFNCATSGHKILTPNGYELIENIKPGTKVISHCGKQRKVERTLQSYVKKTIEIEFSNGNKIRVTPEHPLNNGDIWIESNKLKIGDTIISYDSDLESDNLYKANASIEDHVTEQFSKVDHDGL